MPGFARSFADWMPARFAAGMTTTGRFRAKVADYGLKFKGVLRAWPLYGLFVLVMAPLVWFFSMEDRFQQTYPFVRFSDPDDVRANLWKWELTYAAQFVALEFFFRGFLLQSLRRQLSDLTQQANQNGQGQQGQQGQQQGGGGNLPPQFSDKHTDKGLGQDVQEPANVDAEARAKAEQQIAQKVAQAANMARMAGKLPAGLARLVDEILNPSVPWEELLRDYMTRITNDNESWARRNRRFANVYLPARRDERMGEIVVIDDGSKDRTAQEVRDHFEGDPRVTLLSFENGGKARAVNRGLAVANSLAALAAAAASDARRAAGQALGLLDGLVDAFRQTEIVGGDDDAFHEFIRGSAPDPASRLGLLDLPTDGVQAHGAWRGAGRSPALRRGTWHRIITGYDITCRTTTCGTCAAAASIR